MARFDHKYQICFPVQYRDSTVKRAGTESVDLRTGEGFKLDIPCWLVCFGKLRSTAAAEPVLAL